MKTTSIKKTAACILLALSANAFAQDTKPVTVEMRKFGFGMKFSAFGMEDLGLTSTLSGGKIFFLSINPVKNFRIEPEFGFGKSSSKALNISGDLLNKASHVGGSLFYMAQKSNANFYFGPSVSVSKFSNEQESFQGYVNGVPSYKKEEYNDKDLAFGGILGAEYFFIKHFSLGAELGVFSHKLTQEMPSMTGSGTTEYESNALYTTGNIILRAYF